MADASRFVVPLKTVVTVSVQQKLVRTVTYVKLQSVRPPNFLFASGKPNRYNPAGLGCIYFSEDEQTALVELRRGLAGLAGEFQPTVTFWGDAILRSVLDLTQQDTLKALGMSQADLFEPWVGVAQPTVTQALGEAVAKHSGIVAIRYPSDAARAAGVAGNNVVIFRNQIKSPDSLSILDENGNPLQSWP